MKRIALLGRASTSTMSTVHFARGDVPDMRGDSIGLCYSQFGASGVRMVACRRFHSGSAMEPPEDYWLPSFSSG